MPVLVALHARKCRERKDAGDFQTWRKLLATRWVFLAGGAYLEPPPSSVGAFLEKYQLESVTQPAGLGMTALHYAACEPTSFIRSFPPRANPTVGHPVDRLCEPGREPRTSTGHATLHHR